MERPIGYTPGRQQQEQDDREVFMAVRMHGKGAACTDSIPKVPGRWRLGIPEFFANPGIKKRVVRAHTAIVVLCSAVIACCNNRLALTSWEREVLSRIPSMCAISSWL